MNIYEELNQEIEQYLDLKADRDKFIEDVKDAFGQLGYKVDRETRWHVGNEICHLFYPNNTEKLDKALEEYGLEKTDTTGESVIRVVYDVTSVYSGLNGFKAHLVVDAYGEDYNERSTCISYESEDVTFGEESTALSFAEGLVEELTNILENPEDYLYEPDWAEITVENEADARESAMGDRLEDC